MEIKNFTISYIAHLFNVTKNFLMNSLINEIRN